MPAKRLTEEYGYSLVEVMASIVILALAILPMMAMFDMGLNSATKGSNFDKARAFANAQLEQAKDLNYAQVRESFPVASSTPNYTSAALPVPAGGGLPPGSTYTVAKQYLEQPPQDPVAVDPDFPEEYDFLPGDSDQGLIRVTVTVQWTNNEYTTVGLVAQ